MTAKHRPEQDNEPGFLPHQERVNIEMFKALEILGRKLERVETERDQLARRLALIESAASVDEKTGKLYLPVALDNDMPRIIERAAPKWMVAASLMSSAMALLALGILLFREPAPALTREQLAALNALAGPRFAQLDSTSWQNLPETKVAEEAPVETAAAPEAAAPQSLPDEKQLAADEQLAENMVPQQEPIIMGPPAPPAVAQAQVAPAPSPQDILIPGEDHIPETTVATAAPQPQPEVAAPAPEAAAPAAPVETAAATPAPVVKEEPKAPEPAAAEEKKAEPAPEVASADIPPPPAPVKESRDTSKTMIGHDPALPAKLAALEERAIENVPEAQHDLATLYASGNVVKQDYKRAVYWFSKAADGGIANADYNLGVMFQQGLGVRKDVNKALGWYARASELGHPEAMYNLGIAYIEGVGTKRDIDKGVSYFKKAANAGVSQAAFNLGVLYESSFIGAVDLDKALEWYQVAANEGHKDAQGAIDRINTQIAQANEPDDTNLKVADIEPAAGEEGEGDSSPIDEDGRASPPPAIRNELTAQVQQALIDQGYLPTSANTGRMDARTEDAIRAFQQKNRMTVTGQPSQSLLDKIHAARK